MPCSMPLKVGSEREDLRWLPDPSRGGSGGSRSDNSIWARISKDGGLRVNGGSKTTFGTTFLLIKRKVHILSEILPATRPPWVVG